MIGWFPYGSSLFEGVWVIIYYRQVFLPLGVAWLYEMWYRILLIGCLRLSLGCDTWFTIGYANTWSVVMTTDLQYK